MNIVLDDIGNGVGQKLNVSAIYVLNTSYLSTQCPFCVLADIVGGDRCNGYFFICVLFVFLALKIKRSAVSSKFHSRWISLMRFDIMTDIYAI